MTSPPRTVEGDPAQAAHATRRAHGARPLVWLLRFVAIFVALLLLHLPLLGLPYYWDEAGYFIPAARDIYLTRDFIPHSTLSNAHPPLVMTYLALVWSLIGFHIAVARAAMLAVAALTLVGVFALARRVTNAQVAWATVVCTALYPVFFAQSSLAHLDMAVAAFTVWGLLLYLPSAPGPHDAGGTPASPKRRLALAVLLFSLAALTKETAILVPLTLAGWEVFCWLMNRRSSRSSTRTPEPASAPSSEQTDGRESSITPGTSISSVSSISAGARLCLNHGRSVMWAALLLVPLVPLALWLTYHYLHTGYLFGNPEYVRYNVASTLNLPRILFAAWERLKHVTFHMNLWPLTLATALAMLLPARQRAGVERPRIAIPVQLVFAALILAHVIALSIVGGAVLARYLLPVYPLLLLICVSTIWRRVPLWWLALGLICLAFVWRTNVNPSYSFPWEDNLAYRDFVLLHKDAARTLADRYPHARVLTAWPAVDELTNPYLGYVERRVEVLPVDNFSAESLRAAALRTSEFDLALLYSTHSGLSLVEAAQLLGGRVVFQEERKGQWVALVETTVSADR